MLGRSPIASTAVSSLLRKYWYVPVLADGGFLPGVTVSPVLVGITGVPVLSGVVGTPPALAGVVTQYPTITGSLP